MSRPEKVKLIVDKIECGDFHLSASSLKEFVKSPRHFIEYKIRSLDRDAGTKSTRKGSLNHCKLLTPAMFDKEYVVMPDIVKPGSAAELAFFEAVRAGTAKETAYADNYATTKMSADKILSEATERWKKLEPYAAFLETVKGRNIITNSDAAKADEFSNNTWDNEVAARYLNQVKYFETQVNFIYGGIKFLGYVDGHSDEIVDGQNGLILDLKNIRTGEPRYVKNQILYEGFDIQLELYRLGTGLESAKAGILVSEDAGHCSVTFVSENVLRSARAKIDKAIFDFKRCIMEGAWNQSYEFYSTVQGEAAGAFFVS